MSTPANKNVTPLIKVATAFESVQAQALLGEFTKADEYPEESQVLTKLASCPSGASPRESLARVLGAGIFIGDELNKAAQAG